MQLHAGCTSLLYGTKLLHATYKLNAIKIDHQLRVIINVKPK